MATSQGLRARRFRSAAPHYRAGRPDYARPLIRRVARFVGVSPLSRVLDLGCGPGLLAVAFAPFAAEVVAMDPEPEMLAEVAGQGVPNVTPLLGGSFDLAPELGRFRLVTMGRSFHWMDRAETLRRLDELIEPGGAVALFHAEHTELPENDWADEFKALCRRYADDESRRAQHCAPRWVRHEAPLLESPFRHLERIAVIERRSVPVSALIDRALSMSSTSPEVLGERVQDLAAEITAFGRDRVPDSRFTEVIESDALLAFRPGEQPA